MSLRPSATSSSPPWQVLVLVANHLDPKTLAMASCVCKSWIISMSSDNLWKPVCSGKFPSHSNLRSADTAMPYRPLYSLGHVSAKRRLQEPLKPHLSLDNLLTIDVHNNDSSVFTTVKRGAELNSDANRVVRFDMDVIHDENFSEVDALDGLMVTWNVVLEGFKGVFTMIDCKGKGSFVPGTDEWFSEELPSPGCCCSSVATSGLVADLRIGLRGKGDSGGKTRVEKVGWVC